LFLLKHSWFWRQWGQPSVFRVGLDACAYSSTKAFRESQHGPGIDERLPHFAKEFGVRPRVAIDLRLSSGTRWSVRNKELDRKLRRNYG
jgi:hypothetical protein